MRKNRAVVRPVVKDPVYNSELVTQLVNKVLLDGKKSTAERIVYGALEACREKTRSVPSRRLWATSARTWRSVPVVSVAPPTRCRSRSVRAVPTPWLCVGW